MNTLSALGAVLGTGFSSGLNLYATIVTLGLLQRFGLIHLPPSMQMISHPWILGIAAALYFIEFLADKIPYIDTLWDAVPPRCWLTPRLARYRPSGAGAPPSSPEEWHSHRIVPRPPPARR
jgi:hypothetical protein